MCLLQHGTPPLLIAAGCGNIQIIEVLMRKGAEIQANDKVKNICFGVTCVVKIASYGNQVAVMRKWTVTLWQQLSPLYINIAKV